MTRQINVGLIGVGYWGSNLERVLTESADFKLVCVADNAPGRGDCTVDDLLHRDDIDAVVIATPAPSHADLVLAALQAGKHVLVEKPLAMTLEDAELCCDLADEMRVQLMCDHTYVFSPGLAAVRAALVELGRVIAVQTVRMHHGGPSDVNSLWDLLPHDLSICQALAPTWWDEPPKVTVIGDGEVGTVWFNWERRRCIVEYSRRSADKTRFVSVATGDGARVRWVDHPVARVFVERPDHDEIIEVPVLAGESLANMVAAFATSIMFHKPSLSSGRRALPLIEAIERAAREVE